MIRNNEEGKDLLYNGHRDAMRCLLNQKVARSRLNAGRPDIAEDRGCEDGNERLNVLCDNYLSL